MTKKEIQKILKEPFYNDIYKETNSFDLIDEGGFFFDTNNEKINWRKHTNLLCTPINFLKSNDDIFQSKPKCVLISTGAFSPLHDGHIDMMVAAKAEMENNNWNVLGGYLSPGHDEYIKQKTGSDWIPIHDRIAYANDKIKNYDWLAIDPWEGVFAPGAVNFTSVVHRLNLYLKKHYANDISIFFVCGADNARFALTFKNYKEFQEFGTVIVRRPKYNERINKYLDMTNVYEALCNNHMSSTLLRSEGFTIPKKPTQLYFRLFWNNFEKQLKTQLQKQFKVVWPLDIKEQNEKWREVIWHSDIDENQIINLDVESTFGSRLNVSRLYDVYGQKMLGYTQRPDEKYHIVEQVAYLRKAKDEVYLFDDDICSGKTMDYVEGFLNSKGYVVKGRFSYITSNENTEVLDAKDFIIGGDGGLVIQYNKKLIRVPYIYPFVCPTTRASIDNPLDFSIDIWKTNMNYYQNKDIFLSDVNMKYAYKLGFNKDTDVYTFCKYYYEFLLNIKKHYN